MTKDFYDLLGVDEDASKEEIRDSFRDLVQEYHPDRNDDPRATAQFTALKKAYDTLKNSSERQSYDRLGHTTYVSKRLDGLPDPDSWPTEDGTDSSGTESNAAASSSAGASTGTDRSSGRSDDRGTSRTTSTGSSTSGSSGSSTSSPTGSTSRTGSSTTGSGPSDSSGASHSAGASNSANTSGSAGASAGSRNAGSGTTSATGPGSTADAADSKRASASRSGSTVGDGGTAHAAGAASATGGGVASGQSVGSTADTGATGDGASGVLFDNALARWIRTASLGWPLIFLSIALYLAGGGYYGYANRAGLATLVDELGAAGGDVAALRAALSGDRYGVTPALEHVTTTIGADPTGAAAGVFIAGAALMPVVFFVVIRKTRQYYGWDPSYLYVLGVAAPAIGLGANAAIEAGAVAAYETMPLALELACYGVVPGLAIATLLTRGFVWPRIRALRN